jgi:hypothetical protein
MLTRSRSVPGVSEYLRFRSRYQIELIARAGAARATQSLPWLPSTLTNDWVERSIAACDFWRRSQGKNGTQMQANHTFFDLLVLMSSVRMVQVVGPIRSQVLGRQRNGLEHPTGEIQQEGWRVQRLRQ